MQLITNLMFLSVSLLVFFAYRQGIKDGYYIYNNLPLAKPKREEKFDEEYSKMMNYDFEMEGEENVWITDNIDRNTNENRERK